MLPSHIGERAFIKTACKWWLVSVLIKIQPHVRYSAGANRLLPPPPLLRLSPNIHWDMHTYSDRGPSSPPSLPTSARPVLIAQRSKADLRGPYKWEGCKCRQKAETNHATAVSRFLLNLFNWGGSGRTVKNIHTLFPVRTLLAYLEWLSRQGISANGQKYIKLISRWMLSGVMMLHKSWFDHCGQGLNPELTNAHSSVLDWIFCLRDRSP